MGNILKNHPLVSKNFEFRIISTGGLHRKKNIFVKYIFKKYIFPDTETLIFKIEVQVYLFLKYSITKCCQTSNFKINMSVPKKIISYTRTYLELQKYLYWIKFFTQNNSEFKIITHK